MMTKNVTVVRYDKDLEETLHGIQGLRAKFEQVQIPDTGKWANQSLFYMRELFHMFDIAEIIAKSALMRKESRGAHYKPDYPDRNDADWLKTTIAEYKNGGVEISYEGVDLSHFEPVLRNYAK